MVATASSAVLRIWYEANDATLFVTFVGGKTYAMKACPCRSVVLSSRLNRTADFSTLTSAIGIPIGS
jgi:hypothetical protein